MNDLVSEIKDRSRLLDVAVSECKKRGIKYAETEEGKIAFGKNCRRNLKRCCYNEGSYAVREKMLSDDS